MYIYIYIYTYVCVFKYDTRILEIEIVKRIFIFNISLSTYLSDM